MACKNFVIHGETPKCQITLLSAAPAIVSLSDNVSPCMGSFNCLMPSTRIPNIFRLHPTVLSKQRNMLAFDAIKFREKVINWLILVRTISKPSDFHQTQMSKSFMRASSKHYQILSQHNSKRKLHFSSVCVRSTTLLVLRPQ